MVLEDSVFGGRAPASNGVAPWSAGTVAEAGEPARVDLLRVLTGLRHLAGSTEPARVFTELAAVCVPAFCDDIVIDIEEAGGHRYRIRRPGGSPLAAVVDTPQANPGTAENTGPEPAAQDVQLTERSVFVRVDSLPGAGPHYTARLVCSWYTGGYTPADADAALLRVLANHATALVHRDRTARPLTASGAAGQIGTALVDTQRVAAAAGVLVALHHLSPVQARQLLARAGDRTHRSLRDVADTVLRTGDLPQHRTLGADTEARTDTPDSKRSLSTGNERAVTGGSGERPRSTFG